jgi:hypothetical protein
MTRQEKLVIIGLLMALLLGTAVHRWRHHHEHVSTHRDLKSHPGTP